MQGLPGAAGKDEENRGPGGGRERVKKWTAAADTAVSPTPQTVCSCMQGRTDAGRKRRRILGLEEDYSQAQLR